MTQYNENGQFNSALEMKDLSEYKVENGLKDDEYKNFFFCKINKDIECTGKNQIFNTEMYFHIPFCEKKCIYCPYISIETNDRKKMDNYVKTLILEYNNYMKNIKCSKLNISSIYFGGGTPSMLSIDNFKAIFKNIIKYKYKFSDPLEICIEFLPSHVYANNLASELVDLINNTFHNPKIRFSTGVQSFDPKVNEIINRAHGIEEAKYAIQVLHELYNNNSNFGFNVDLMIGLPEQSYTSIINDIEFLINKKVPSISLDHTRILENTVLFTVKDKFTYLSENEIKDAKNKIYTLLSKNNYRPIGKGDFITWNLPGYRRVYKAGNSNRIAFGASAISDFPTIRYCNYDSIVKYINDCNNGELPHESATNLDLYDQIYMKLREQLRVYGLIDILDLDNNYKMDFKKQYNTSIRNVIQNKYMYKKDMKLYLNKGYDMFDVLKFFNNRKSDVTIGISK